jgi:hypothetical protein
MLTISKVTGIRALILRNQTVTTWKFCRARMMIEVARIMSR